MSTVFQNLMESKTDQELEDFQNDYKKYTHDALSCYLLEIRKRKLDIDHISEIESWVKNLEYEKFKNRLSLVSKLNWDDAPNRNDVISVHQFFGINFFTRTRCRSVVLKPRTFKSSTKFPTLCLCSQMRFLEDLSTFKSENEWREMACELMMSTVYNLQSQNIITISAIQDKYSYLSNFNNYKEELSITLNSAERTKDILSDLIIKTLNKKEKNEYQVYDFTQVVTVLVNKIIGIKESNYSEKDFVINLLKLYSKSFDFIHLSNVRGVFGLSKRYELEINEKEQQVLQSQYVESGDLKMIDKEDSELDIFQFCRMRKDIIKEFLKRNVD